MCVHKEELTELGKYIVDPALTCTVYGPVQQVPVPVPCAQSLKTTLFRLLGAQGTTVFSSVNLAQAIFFTVLLGGIRKRRGNK